jgi:hypothetical protein
VNTGVGTAMGSHFVTLAYERKCEHDADETEGKGKACREIERRKVR